MLRIVLRAALDSVLDQTWRDLEVLVVDDASTDATAECLAGVTDPRVRVLRLDHPHGAGGARNAGLRELRNEWIAFQDSDDEWHPDKLEKQMAAAAANPRAGFVFCRCRRSAGGEAYLFPPLHAKTGTGGIFEALLGGNRVSTQTALVRRDCIAAHGVFDEALPPLEDCFESRLFSGVVLVISEKSEVVWNLRPGLVGLRLRRPMVRPRTARSSRPRRG